MAKRPEVIVSQATPVASSSTAFDGSSDIARAVFGIIALILGLFAVWMFFGTSIQNQNYAYCQNAVCQEIFLAKAQAELNRSVPPPLPALIVPAPPAAQQIVMQPAPAPQIIVVPAPQTRIVSAPQQGCGNCRAHFAPIGVPYGMPPPMMGGVYPGMGGPCSPYMGGCADPRRYMGGGMGFRRF